MADRATDGSASWDDHLAVHDRRVVLMLLAMGLRVDQAKEIAQATWLRLIEKQRSGELVRVELPGIALSQARFLALDELRRQGRTAKLVPIDPDIAANVPSQETAMIRREELARALHALDRCSPAAQRVFRAVYDNPGASHAEAATSLGLSIQRVRQVLCEVRQKIRTAIEVTDD